MLIVKFYFLFKKKKKKLHPLAMFKNSWKLHASSSNKNICACKMFLTKEVSVCVFLHLINIHAQEQGRMTFLKLKYYQ